MRLGLGLGSSLVSSGEWTPLDLPSIFSWHTSTLGVENEGGVTPDDGEDVAIWRDQSPTGLTFTCDNTTKPTYSASDTSVYFGSGNAGPSFTEKAFNECSIYIKILFQDGFTITNGDILFSDNGGGDFIKPNTTTQMRWRLYGVNYNFTIPSALVTGQYYVIGVERGSDSNVRAFLDFVELTQSTGGTSDPSEKFTTDTYSGGNKAYTKSIVMSTDSLSDEDRLLLKAHMYNQ